MNRILKGCEEEEKLNIIDRLSPVLAKVIHSIKKFVRNELEGKILSEFPIGEIIEAR
jgi:hypothetical protein